MSNGYLQTLKTGRMLCLVVWITLQCVVAVHATVKQYDMWQICHTTVSMDADNVYGFKILMNMTSQLIPTGSCRLVIDRNADYDHLHFYFSHADLGDCNQMALYIQEAQTGQNMSQFYVPSVCGTNTSNAVNVDYTTSSRYLALELTWDPGTAKTGIVFTLVANSYTCEESCENKHSCGDNVCISTSLISQSGANFCGISTLSCEAGGEDLLILRVLWAIGGVAVIFIVCYVCSRPGLYRKGQARKTEPAETTQTPESTEHHERTEGVLTTQTPENTEHHERTEGVLTTQTSENTEHHERTEGAERTEPVGRTENRVNADLRRILVFLLAGLRRGYHTVNARLTDFCCWVQNKCAREARPSPATTQDQATATDVGMMEISVVPRRPMPCDDEYDQLEGAIGFSPSSPPPSYDVAMATTLTIQPLHPPSYDAATGRGEPPDYHIVKANKQ